MEENGPDTGRWMTVAELAAYVQLSRSKIYEMAQRGEIPCVKVAGRWRFRRGQVDEWMLSPPRPPSPENVDEATMQTQGNDHDPAR